MGSIILNTPKVMIAGKLVGQNLHFLDIQTELICHILSFLGHRDLLHCSETCTLMSKCISASSPLQHTIDLAIAGLMPTLGFTRLTLAARRRLLAQREHAWKYLRWNKYGPLDLGQTGSVYEFASGVYANGREDDRKLTRSISFYAFPQAGLATDGKPGETTNWVHSMDDVSVVDFTMDPMQDLLVLIGRAPEISGFLYEAQVRSLSTNESHPLVPPNSQFLALVEDQADNQSDLWSSVRVQIVGSYVGLVIKEVLDGGVGAHLEIWNWRAGSARSCILVARVGIDDFCFLSVDSFLIAHPEGRFEIYSFTDPALSDQFTRTPTCIAHYVFPTLAQNAMYWYISISVNPVAGYVPSPRPPSPSPRSFPLQQPRVDGSSMAQSHICFEPPPFYPIAERILSCSLCVFDPARPVDHDNGFVFFVDTRTFLHAQVDASAQGQSPQLYLWHAWGPRATRFFEEQSSTDWQHALFGYRTIEAVKTATLQKHLRIRDYNPVSVARATEEEQEHNYATDDGKTIGKRTIRVVKGLSTVSKGAAFKENIVTSLPYIEIESEETFEVTDVMMDDNLILLLKRGSTGNLSGINVLSVP